MARTSRGNARLGQLYGMALRRCRWLNALAEHGVRRPDFQTQRRSKGNTIRRVLGVAEQLEPRLLLASDYSFEYDGSALEAGFAYELVADDTSGHPVLRDVENEVLIPWTSESSQASNLDTFAVTITGSMNQDSLLIDASASSFITTFDGGEDVDELLGPEIDNSWRITAEDVGSLNSTLMFASIENLVGAVGYTDSFVIEDGGSISGLITGSPEDADQISVVLQATVLPGEDEYRSLQYLETYDSENVEVIGNSTIVDDVTIAAYEGITNFDQLTIVLPDDGTNQQVILSDDTADRYEGWLRLASDASSPTFSPIDFSQPIGQLTLRFGAGDDAFSFAAGAPTPSLRLLVDAGEGSDTIVAPDLENRFSITGENEGVFNDLLKFTQVENLVGAGGFADTFTFEADGVLTGSLQGQSDINAADRIEVELNLSADPQTLERDVVSDSGVITRNGVPVATFAGIDDSSNVRILGTDFDDQIRVDGDSSGIVLTGGNLEGSFGLVSLDTPEDSLQILPGLGDDDVTIASPAMLIPITVDDFWGFSDRLTLEIAADQESIDIGFQPDAEAGRETDGSIQLISSMQEIQYRGIESSQNVVIVGTTTGETLQLSDFIPGRLQVTSEGASATFQPIRFDAPEGSATADRAVAGNGADRP